MLAAQPIAEMLVSEALLPLLAASDGVSLRHGSASDSNSALLSWSAAEPGAPGLEGSSTEDALLAVLRFVIGTLPAVLLPAAAAVLGGFLAAKQRLGTDSCCGTPELGQLLWGNGAIAAAETGLAGSREAAAALGAAAWPKLASAYVEARLAPLAPAGDAQLEAFQKRARAAQRFEEAASALGRACWLPR